MKVFAYGGAARLRLCGRYLRRCLNYKILLPKCIIKTSSLHSSDHSGLGVPTAILAISKIMFGAFLEYPSRNFTVLYRQCFISLFLRSVKYSRWFTNKRFIQYSLISLYSSDFCPERIISNHFFLRVSCSIITFITWHGNRHTLAMRASKHRARRRYCTCIP